jgi:ketosteroid isomerase-like protein
MAIAILGPCRRRTSTLIRQRFEAFNRGDLATLVELTDPAAVWWDRLDDPWGGAPHRGRDACMQHLAEILEDAELEAHPQEFIDAGMRVVVGVQLVGRGRTSGVAFEEHEFHVFTLQDGRVIETREYRERDEALKAVGLSEQAASKTTIGVVRALTEAWNAGDMELIREALHPEVFMRSPEGWPESGPFLGRDAVIRALEQLREPSTPTGTSSSASRLQSAIEWPLGRSGTARDTVRNSDRSQVTSTPCGTSASSSSSSSRTTTRRSGRSGRRRLAWSVPDFTVASRDMQQRGPWCPLLAARKKVSA